MDNKGILIIILTVIVVLGIFAGAFYIIGSNNIKNTVTNNSLNLSDINDDNSSDIKNATLSSNSTSQRHYDDWQKDYETGLYDEYGDPIYRSVFSTSGGQNETRIG